jgi:hypothetical protein
MVERSARVKEETISVWMSSGKSHRESYTDESRSVADSPAVSKPVLHKIRHLSN